MNSPLKILSLSDHFIGRDAEIDRLLAHARREHGGLALLGAPLAGASELLRQVYDRLFSEQEEIIPFYFEIKRSDVSAKNAARRFLDEFLLQTVAFRRRDAKIIGSSPGIREIAELAVPEDGRWIDRLIEACDGEGRFKDGTSVIRHALSSPLRAGAAGARSCVMIDNVSGASRLAEGKQFIEILAEVLSRYSVPFVVAGRRRDLFASMPFEAMHLENLSVTYAGQLVESLAAKTGVAINDQTRDLIAVQMGGNPADIESLMASGIDLDTFDGVENAYTDEIFGGRIGKGFDAIFDAVIPGGEAQAWVIKLLFACLTAKGGSLPEAYFRKRSRIDYDILAALHSHEILSLNAGSVIIDAENIVLCDYIRVRHRLENKGEKRALAVGNSLSEYIKRAPALMARHYRRSDAIGLREIMLAFNGQTVSTALVDYERFKEEFQGADDEKIVKAVKDDNAPLSLPRIIFAAHTAAFYPALSSLTDAERSAVALGFTGRDEETVWIAVEIDSKLEASLETTEFWCDRLEMVALNCNFRDFRLWLVAPEGFSPAAIEALGRRNAYGTSRKQANLLSRFLGVKSTSDNTKNEYEITVPMGDATELIAAHTVEHIARRHGFPQKAINQIKTALVEACINAAEHSLSPDQRIHQKFTVSDDRLTIAISNRGLRLTDKVQAQENQDRARRRGWGLKLIRGLMDEVAVEQTDDGTRITMVKLMPR